MQPADDAPEVGVDDHPLVVQGARLERRGMVDAGVVEEHVEPAGPPCRPVDRLLYLRPVRHVRDEGAHALSMGGERAGSLLHPRAAATEQVHGRALVQQFLGQGEPDAGIRAGDDAGLLSIWRAESVMPVLSTALRVPDPCRLCRDDAPSLKSRAKASILPTAVDLRLASSNGGISPGPSRRDVLSGSKKYPLVTPCSAVRTEDPRRSGVPADWCGNEHVADGAVG